MTFCKWEKLLKESKTYLRHFKSKSTTTRKFKEFLKGYGYTERTVLLHLFPKFTKDGSIRIEGAGNSWFAVLKKD